MKLLLFLVDEYDVIKSSFYLVDILEFKIYKWIFFKFSVYKKFLNILLIYL